MIFTALASFGSLWLLSTQQVNFDKTEFGQSANGDFGAEVAHQRGETTASANGVAAAFGRLRSQPSGHTPNATFGPFMLRPAGLAEATADTATDAATIFFGALSGL